MNKFNTTEARALVEDMRDFEQCDWNDIVMLRHRGANTLTAALAEIERLREALSDLLALMPDDEGPEIENARAALAGETGQ